MSLHGTPFFVKGYLVDLGKVPDPVFSEKMLGDGFAIEPLENRLLSPVDGVVKSIAKAQHAITIASQDGYDVLIHLGLETVALNGQGINVLVNIDDAVTIQTPIIEFDLSYVSRHAKSLLTPVVISNYQGKKPTILSTGVVLANTPVLTVDTGVVNQGSGKETSGSTNTITKKLTINTENYPKF